MSFRWISKHGVLPKTRGLFWSYLFWGSAKWHLNWQHSIIWDAIPVQQHWELELVTESQFGEVQMKTPNVYLQDYVPTALWFFYLKVMPRKTPGSLNWRCLNELQLWGRLERKCWRVTLAKQVDLYNTLDFIFPNNLCKRGVKGTCCISLKKVAFSHPDWTVVGFHNHASQQLKELKTTNWARIVFSSQKCSA